MIVLKLGHNKAEAFCLVFADKSVMKSNSHVNFVKIWHLRNSELIIPHCI